uniref:diphosphoinositol-polyphosphate diphosphatase n=1 Tax=Bos taurus TaxID=9913 RepID=A0AAA9RVZ5_BOVIN
MKCKPNQTRTYDPEGFKKRAACLCFRSEREDEVLLVSSSRYPDRWIVPGGGMEPEEEPGGAAVREVFEEAGVKGKLGRLLGIFEQNQDRKHRTYVYVLTVTEILEDWEDSVSIGRKREWFKVEDAIKVLQCHKPVHAEYLQKLKLGGSPTNGNSVAPPAGGRSLVNGIDVQIYFERIKYMNPVMNGIMKTGELFHTPKDTARPILLDTSSLFIAMTILQVVALLLYLYRLLIWHLWPSLCSYDYVSVFPTRLCDLECKDLISFIFL